MRMCIMSHTGTDGIRVYSEGGLGRGAALHFNNIYPNFAAGTASWSVYTKLAGSMTAACYRWIFYSFLCLHIIRVMMCLPKALLVVMQNVKEVSYTLFYSYIVVINNCMIMIIRHNYYTRTSYKWHDHLNRHINIISLYVPISLQSNICIYDQFNS